jgi:hypothetical protein
MTTSAYTKATSLGYPYRWGEGRNKDTPICVADQTVIHRVWLTRFQKTNDPTETDAVFVGWDNLNNRWVIEHE